MSDDSKPLFSRPVLAAVMLFCTLAIWLLNLTAPSSKLPTPQIEKWTTTSGIPVVWIKQAEWQDSNKLEIRFSFRSVTTNISLIQTTLAMLMSDSLPLSTASINQRLAPLAASANSYYDHENQTIGLTVSNESKYLVPTLSLATNWLKQPDFKRRTFDAWQTRNKTVQPIQHELENILFFDKTSKQNDTAKTQVSLKQVSDYYQNLKSSAATIFIVGDMAPDIKQTVQNAINTISQDYQLSKASAEAIHYESVSTTIQQNEGELWQTRSAIALMPVSSIKEWISLQIWGADLVATLNQQQHIDFVQLAFTLSPQRPWARWNIQYADNITKRISEGSYDTSRFMNAKSLVFVEQIPSANSKETFGTLLDNFKQQLEQQTLSPTWWSYIATQVTHEDGALTVEEFANGYKEAVDSFTIEDYQTSLKHLLKPSSYQEIQVYQ
ncbi:insulinase family protein [Marinomonas sp. CT5]|uniref:insulinase family protein n=1 Tax=Marinomonas sp. CT5 TaxID=2066133 RepID=UPI001BB0ABA6|nr:insulinase family protein [Marinomonas sp. CT5]QUX97838.1 insulinase family protein [Marinomonas sp. CT5]